MKITKYNISLRFGKPREFPQGSDGFYDSEGREIVLRKSSGDKKWRKFVIRHELGHAIYGGDLHSFRYGETIFIPLTEELIANYYALTIDPRDENARGNIRAFKLAALKNGMEPAIVELKEKIAMDKVGYKDKPVGWGWS